MLQALAVAAGDARPSVVDAALDAVQAVTAALFRGVGVDADSFGPLCDVVETAMRNPLHEGLSVRATGIVPDIAQRLRASADQVGDCRRVRLAWDVGAIGGYLDRYVFVRWEESE